MKILNRLTLKNLKLNKSRTIVTIIGIMLSTALITVVAGMASSAQQTMINAQIHISGDYDMSISEFSPSDIETVENNRDVKAVYIVDELGCAYLPGAKSESRPYINITALSKGALENCFPSPLLEGRYPENDSELVISQDIINSSDKSFKVGDTVTLEIGDRYDAYDNLLPDKTEYGLTLGEYGEEYYVSDMPETLRVKQTKTYEIVGILNDNGNQSLIADKATAVCTALTYTDAENLTDNSAMYVQFLPEREKDYINVAAGITGLTDDEVELYLTDDLEYFDGLCAKSRYSSFEINTYLLQYKGYGNSDETMSMLYSLAGIIIAIIIIAGVFVIRNSFAISITEKTKLYGMLASVGATSKQIRKNVLFEGFILGLIGIPLGLLLGVGVAALLIVILNVLLEESLNGISFVYSIPVIAVALAVVLSAVTILLSTVSSAIRASRISPITAIRSNNDVKISKRNRKDKKYKSPKFIRKLFGVGGDIAYKNLKRSRKKYRTTVVSIVVSVTLFIAMFSFVEYVNRFTAEYYTALDYNISVNIYFPSDVNEALKELDTVRAKEGVDSSYVEKTGYAYFEVQSDEITDKAKTSGYADISSIPTENNCYTAYLNFYAAESDRYKKILKDFGFDYDEVKDKGIFINQFPYAEDGKTRWAKVFEKDSGYTLRGMSGNTDVINCEIEIAGSIENISADELSKYGLSYQTILVSEEWFEENVDNEAKSYSLYIQTDDADKLEEEINELGYSDISVGNVDKLARQTNAMVLVLGIFIYGFIIVITLIGVTSIFNTITTNMKLRSKEFATLKSIGMTKKEFNRMIRLESLFYGAKSLLIGIPLGILGSLGICRAFSERIEYIYEAPWTAIIISIVFVFAVVWLIMRFSVGKVSRQNIIETIRNDNI